MFNLLPEPEKKQILSEYKLRRNVLTLIFLFVIGVIATLSIFPSYILSSSKVLEAEVSVATIKTSQVFKEESDLNILLAQTNLKLKVLQPAADELYVSDLFEVLIKESASTTRLNGFLYKRGDDKVKGQISLSGISRDRTSLLTFVSSLEKNPLFLKVDLPVSNFTKERNADFSLQIKGNFK